MDSPDLTIRPVRPHEHEELAELTVRVYREVLASELVEYSRVLRDVAGRISHGCQVLVARQAGRLAGGVTYVDRTGPLAQLVRMGEAELRMLAVDPALHGRGIGTALVQAGLELARSGGREALVLGTMPEMVAAHRLYWRLGFRRAPERDRLLDGGHPLLVYVADTGVGQGRRPDGPSSP